ncbi:TNFAIP3-interacting protein 2 [Callorhinchus milii]|uniref:TNFAIP3-interacting protein 2 n=1 Tax=Callorhinchus milii TaxID=7868 RepID=V9KEX0_CALMI|nr:TNFAIP3-interacting protein 2 [Callorhinchus milii]|eukprot:gi/632974022/ref/XP_007903442.1/ PREDICTED: TNFAIP3-interacting protein 2 [Callorhinchus milii]
MSSKKSSDSPARRVANYNVVEELVERLQKENRSLKGILRGQTTINTFYHEARQELGHLAHQVAVKDSLIKELRARLELYEQKATCNPQDSALPCALPSRSLLDSLLQQISRLKQQLTDCQSDWRQDRDKLVQEEKRLQQQLREKERDMQQLMSCPEHEKEAEIMKLRRAMKEKERLHATREVWCRSLTDETEELRARLAGTAKMCQQLALQLEEKQPKRQHSALEEQVSTEQPNKLNEMDFSDAATLQAANCKLVEENRALKEKAIYVEDLNAKWQRYDSSREEYIKGIHSQLRELQTKVGQQKGFSAVAAAPDMLQHEILRLNRLLGEKIKECSRLEGQRDGLEKEKSDVQRAREVDWERMQMLEHQVMVYTDDFRSERADRERAQSRIQELEEELANLKQQLLRKQETRNSAVHHQAPLGHMNMYFVEPDGAEQLLGNVANQSASNRSSEPPDPARRTGASRGPELEARLQGSLQCPKCLRVFNDEISEECLKHIADCCQ